MRRCRRSTHSTWVARFGSRALHGRGDGGAPAQGDLLRAPGRVDDRAACCSPARSTDLVVQTMLGTAKPCVTKRCIRRAQARRRGGTTIAAIRELEQAGVRAAFHRCDPGCDDPLARAGGRRRLARSFRRGRARRSEDERRLDLVWSTRERRWERSISIPGHSPRPSAAPRTSRTPVVPRRYDVSPSQRLPAGNSPPARGTPRAGRSARSSPSRCRCRCRARSGARLARTRRRGSPPSSGRRTPARPHRRAARARRSRRAFHG